MSAKFDYNVLRAYSPKGLERAKKRIYRTRIKSMLIAYILWFLFCMLGIHRLYLGLWKSALGIVGMFLLFSFLPLLAAFVAEQQVGVSNLANSISFWGLLLLFVLEGVFLHKLVKNKNAKIWQDIEVKTSFL